MNSHQKTRRERSGPARLAAFFTTLAAMVGLATSSSAANFSVTSAPIVAESCAPGNGAFDPGETVTVNVTFKNTSTSATRNNVKVTFKPEAGKVIHIASADLAQINLGNLAPEATVSRQFTFVVGAKNCASDTLTLKWDIVADSVGAEEVAIGPFNLGTIVDTTSNFTNGASITIRDNNTAGTFPSSVTVPALSGAVTRVRVTLNGIDHLSSGDIDMALVGPTGQVVMLMSDAGASSISGNVTIADNGANTLPIPASSTPITTGSYKPANYGTVETDLGGVNVSAATTTLSSFNGLAPNGTWNLYIVDDNAGQAGVVAGGWTLEITTSVRTCCTTTTPIIGLSSTVRAIPAQTVLEDAANTTLNFFVDSFSANPNSLVVQAFSSDLSKVPSDRLSTGGSGNNRSVTYRPAANANGAVTITLRVTDPANDQSATIDFTLNITPVNDTPTITNPGNQAANVGAPTAVASFTVADIEDAAGTLIVTAVSDNTGVVPNANIFIGGAGSGSKTVQVFPASSSTDGTANIQLTVTDSNGASATQTFTVAFNIQAGFPVVNPISPVTVNEDNSATVAVVVSDSSTPANSLVITPTHNNSDLIASLTLTGSGNNRSLQITPKANAFGVATISVAVRNAANNTTTATFTFTVNAVNDKPTISQVANFSINEDTPSSDISFTVGDVETAAGSLTVTAHNSTDTTLIPLNPSNITLGGSGASRTVKITPAANQFGRSVITLRVSDGTDTTDMSFEVTVVPVNDQPNFDDIANVTVDEDADTTTVNVTGMTVGPENEVGQSLTLVATSSNPALIPSPLTVVYTSPNATGELRFKPVANANGTATITVIVSDNGGGSNSRSKTFTITVTPKNDAPDSSVIADQFTARDTPITVPFTVSDLESPASALTVSVSSGNTTVIPNGHPNLFVTGTGSTRLINIQPATGQSGTVVITYTVTDDGAGESPANIKNRVRTFTIVVSPNPPNRRPTINPIANVTADEDSFIVVTPIIVGDLDDPLAQSLTFTATSNNQDLISNANITTATIVDNNGTPMDTSDDNHTQRQIIMVPNRDAFGTAIITVTVTDGGDASGINKLSQSTTFTVTVNPVEDVPLITTEAGADLTVVNVAAINEDSETAAITFRARDAETAPGDLTFEFTSSNTTVIPANAANVIIAMPDAGDPTKRTVKLKPAANQNTTPLAPITVKVIVKDAAGLQDSFDIILAGVNAINDEPTLNPISNPAPITQGSGSQTVALSGIGPGGGPDEAGQTLTISAVSDNPGLVPNPTIGAISSGNATLTYVPGAGFGTAKITVTLTDSGSNVAPNDNIITREFTITITQVNAAPTISEISNVTIAQGGASSPITFTVGDAETPASQLVVTATSSNEALVPNSGLQLGGTTTSRSIIVTPLASAFGTTTITVTVTDKGNAAGDASSIRSASRTFVVTVTQVQQAPRIVSITPNPLVTDVNVESPIATVVVSDQETAPGDLVLTVDSNSNPSLTRSIQFLKVGDGSTRLMIVVPSQNQTGSATITLKVTDTTPGTPQTATRSFTFTVLTPNVAPTITSIGAQTTGDGQTVGPIAFTVGDVETAASFLQTTATSSNTALVPNANITIAGPLTPGSGLTGGARRISVTPVAGQSGTTTITVTVFDGTPGDPGVKSASTSFTVTVTSTNTNPVISALQNQTTQQNVATAQQTFTITDNETASGFLSLSYTSSNPALVSSTTGVQFGGSGANRTITIIPTQGQSGTATITVTVSDTHVPPGTASRSFTVTVLAPVVARDDFDGDGKADIVYQDAEGFVAIWYMDGENLRSATLTTPNNVGDAAFRVIATGDFNRDGKPDLLLQNSVTGLMAIWYMNNATVTETVLTNPSNPGQGWKAIGVGDFNGDGRPDILFQHTNGTLAVWYMNGASLTVPTLLNPSHPGEGWSAIATGDFNNDGNTDIVFGHTDKSLATWFMNGVDLNSPSLFNPGNTGDWSVVGATDLDGDGQTDLLLSQPVEGLVGAWFMNGLNLVRPTLLNPSVPGGSWQIVAP